MRTPLALRLARLMTAAVNKPDCEEKICSSAKSAFAAMMRGKKKVGVAGDSAGGSTPATAAGSASPPDEECPEDRESLGRSSWSLLHSMAAYYPNSPDDRRRDDTRQFLHLFSVLYPCTHCAEDLREWMTAHPPVTSSRATLSKWMCEGKGQLFRAY